MKDSGFARGEGSIVLGIKKRDGQGSHIYVCAYVSTGRER